MPVVLTTAVSRLVFSMRAARHRSIARQSGRKYKTSKGWQSLAESHGGESEDGILIEDRQEVPRARYSTTTVDSDSGNEGETSQPAMSRKIPNSTTRREPNPSEVEAGESLLGRESTRVVSQSECEADHQRGSTLEPPELEWGSTGSFRAPALVVGEISCWSPDTPVQRVPFKWPAIR